MQELFWNSKRELFDIVKCLRGNNPVTRRCPRFAVQKTALLQGRKLFCFRASHERPFFCSFADPLRIHATYICSSAALSWLLCCSSASPCVAHLAPSACPFAAPLRPSDAPHAALCSSPDAPPLIPLLPLLFAAPLARICKACKDLRRFATI